MASALVIRAVLLAGLYAEGEDTGPPSPQGPVDHTELALEEFGARIESVAAPFHPWTGPLTTERRRCSQSLDVPEIFPQHFLVRAASLLPESNVYMPTSD